MKIPSLIHSGVNDITFSKSCVILIPTEVTTFTL